MVTGEEQPQLPPQAFWDAVEDQLSGSGGSVHANTSTKLGEMDVPRLLLHLLLHLEEQRREEFTYISGIL